MRSRILIPLAAAALALAGLAAVPALFPVLKSNVRIGRQPQGFFLLPTNQLLQPWGEQSVVKGRPVDAALDSGKRLLAVLNTRGIDIFDALTGAPIGTARTKASSYTGIAFRPGANEIWTGETSRSGADFLLVTPVSETGTPGTGVEIPLGKHSVPSGIAFSEDGKTAWVAMSRSNTVAVFDAEAKKLVKEIEVGVAPFAVAYSKQHHAVYVSNRGGRRAKPTETTAPSSGTNVLTDPFTGSSISGTVNVIDVSTGSNKELAVGRAPSGLALSKDESTLAVANGHSDSVSIIDTKTLAITEVKIPAYPEGVTGSQPIAVAFTNDGKTLYAACAGTNALAALQGAGAKWKVAGSIPAGWFPSSISVMDDGSLRVVNVKGTGNTANGRGAFVSTAYEGSVVRIPALDSGRLAAATREVIAANSPQMEPAGGVANLVSLGIQHVLLIVKENRTYDQVLGDLKQANGDPSLTMFGKEVTPNHHALAEQFVILDNFHTGGAISFDGHQWLMQSFVSDYTERAFAASPRGYAWNMADALTVSPAGFFWQGAPKPPTVRIYGEFCLPARWDAATKSVVDMNESELLQWSDYWKLYKEGKLKDMVASRSGVPALQKLIDERYPVNDTSITDQIRADEFLRELGTFEQSGEMPQLSVLTLTSDHTNGTRPGSPTPRAMVADDDLALGRIVAGVSKSRFWASTLVLVVEDDAQNGLDHVDGHRTVALAIGPHIRRGVVDSNFYNHSSMIRTIQDIFRIPPQTRFVAAARPMTSIFTATSDAKTYAAIEPGIAFDEMNPPLRALQGRERWAAQQSLAMNWHDPDDVPSDVLNRILWWNSKGYDKEYPQRLGTSAKAQ
jgi:YVTN family beta-propeller protein